VLGFLAVVMPLFFGAGRVQVPLHQLLVFPLGRWKLYRVALGASLASGANLFWYPILASVTCVALAFNDVPATYWLMVVALLAACFVIWLNTLLTLVQWILRKRSIRELVVLICLVLLIVVTLLPIAFEEEVDERREEWLGDLVPQPVISAIGRMASVFPPAIAVRGLEAAVLGEPGNGVVTLVWLTLWAVAGVIMGFGIVRSFLLEGGRPIRSRSRTTVPTRGALARRWAVHLAVFPAAIRAVAAKELHYLFRSTVGKFNIVIMPLFVVVMALVVARDLDQAFLGLERASLVFVGLMIYASMFSNNFLFNAYAWEGAGVQSFFFSPVKPKQIVVGKNLGVWTYNLVLGAEGVIAFCVISGVPPLTALLGGCLAFVAALLLATIVGNFLSPAMPVARDISSITNSPSQTAVLATFAVLIINALVIGGCLTLPAVLGLAWLGPLLLVGLVAFEAVLYVTMLRPAARLLDSRRESLIEALQSQ
jgi:hypothetical protein